MARKGGILLVGTTLSQVSPQRLNTFSFLQISPYGISAHSFFSFCFNPCPRICPLISETGEGRGKEKKRNIDWLPFCTCPDWRLNWQPGHVPWLGIEPSTFWFTGWCPINWAMPPRTSCFLKKFMELYTLRFIYLFLERWGGREIERERNIDWLPQPWTGPAMRACALIRIEPMTFQFVGWCPNNWATPVRALCLFWFVFNCSLHWVLFCIRFRCIA